MSATKPRLILFPELKPKKGIPYSKSTIRRLERDGRFPRRVRPSPGIVAWVEQEVDAHVAGLIEQRDNGR